MSMGLPKETSGRSPKLVQNSDNVRDIDDNVQHVMTIKVRG
jgi:hypothetical protein